MQAWPTHSIHTHNVTINSENKIHDDAEAKKYGFSGGLVAGTTVYAHMTYPMVLQHGIEWLTHHVGHLRLYKPAYEGEHLTVKTDPPHAGGHLATVHIYNDATAELARLETGIAPQLPDLDALSKMPPAPPSSGRTPISWDAVVPGRPLRAFYWNPTPEQQADWCKSASDPLAVYKAPDSPVHPGLILQAANNVLSHHYALKPWIHTESRIVTRDALRVGKPVEVRAVTMERWEKKGHQFLKLYVAMISPHGVAVEVYHTAIFSVRMVA